MQNNQFAGIAYVATDPEIKYFEGGTCKAKFRGGLERPAKKGEKKTSAYVDVVAWGKTAEFLVEWFHKGDYIAIAGRLDMEEWGEGEAKRSKNTIVIETAGFVPGKKADGESGASSTKPKAAADDSEEIPF